MSNKKQALAGLVEQRLGDVLRRIASGCGELTFETSPEHLLDACRELRDGEGLQFDMLVDLCAVDYLHYGRSEWATRETTATGFGRGVDSGPGGERNHRRFAVVYHLNSISLNHRIRLKVFVPDDDPPVIESVTGIWPSADWFEREAFDLFGVLFNGHPDLRRILTDYGFVGHPFRKDFPLIGNVEVRYDPAKGRVVYEPVSIQPRTLVPRVIRQEQGEPTAIRDDGEHG